MGCLLFSVAGINSTYSLHVVGLSEPTSAEIRVPLCRSWGFQELYALHNNRPAKAILLMVISIQKHVDSLCIIQKTNCFHLLGSCIRLRGTLSLICSARCLRCKMGGLLCEMGSLLCEMGGLLCEMGNLLSEWAVCCVKCVCVLVSLCPEQQWDETRYRIFVSDCN